MKKIIKNKYVILVICILVISIIYLSVKKAINNDKNISVEEDNEEISQEEGIIFTDEEIDLELAEPNEIDVKDEEEENWDGGTKNETDGLKKINEGKSKIYIHITGEVNNPGVITLNEGSRIVDAINAAGGTTSNADISRINLVYILEDGMKVNIPDNSNENANYEYITKSSGEGRGNDKEEIDINKETSNSEKYSVVNINSATQTELESLPGIGPSLALKIINYRKENGKFSSIEQIKEVSGIGDAKYNELKKYITI